MPYYADGTKINQDEWGRLIQSIPTTYTVWVDGATIRGESNEDGGTDYSDPDASTVIQNCVTAVAGGGTVFIRDGSYTLTSKVTAVPTGIMRIISDGATLTPPASDYALEVDSGAPDAIEKRCMISGLRFNHTGTQTGSGIKIQDSYRTVISDCSFEDLDNGIYLTDTTSNWTEGTMGYSLQFNDCSGAAIKFEQGTGGGSFANSHFTGVGVEMRTTGAVGLELIDGATMSHTVFDDCRFWSYADSSTQVSIDTNMKNVQFRGLVCESFVAGPAALIGISLGGNTMNIPIFIPYPFFTGSGTFSSNISNAGNEKYMVYDEDVITLYNQSAGVDCEFDLSTGILANLKNHAHSALSGTKKLVEIDIGGVPYYWEVYPTKA